MSARWDIIQSNVDDVHVYDVEQESMRQFSFWKMCGKDAVRRPRMSDGSRIVECIGERSIRYVPRRRMTILINNNTRHV